MPGFSTKSLQRRTFAGRDFICKLAEKLAEPSVQNRNHIPAQGSLTEDETHPKSSVKPKFPARETALLACVLNATNLYVELAPTTFNVYATRVMMQQIELDCYFHVVLRE